MGKATPVVQWLLYSPLDPRFAGSIPAGVDGLFQSVKILTMTSQMLKSVIKPNNNNNRLGEGKLAKKKKLFYYTNSINK